MTITPAKLTRAAGLSAVAAGLLFIFVQFIHPTENVSAVTGSAWATTHYLTMAMAVLRLAGVSGLYLRQVREAGLLGLVGFILFSLAVDRPDPVAPTRFPTYGRHPGRDRAGRARALALA
jgi:hypothetical protein